MGGGVTSLPQKTGRTFLCLTQTHQTQHLLQRFDHEATPLAARTGKWLGGWRRNEETATEEQMMAEMLMGEKPKKPGTRKGVKDQWRKM